METEDKTVVRKAFIGTVGCVLNYYRCLCLIYSDIKDSFVGPCGACRQVLMEWNSFSDGIKEIENKLDSLNQLKVKGLILGPIHTVQADQISTLNLKEIDIEMGTEKDLDSLLERAHKKGISIVLDLTPNYTGAAAWFSNIAAATEKLSDACAYWLQKGVDGFLLSDISRATNSPSWESIQNVVHSSTREGTKKRGKERALLHGEFTSLHSSTYSFAFLRLWDQSERFITVLNWGDSPVTMSLTNSNLPAEARVRLSTDTEKLAVDSMIPLEKLQLEAKQAVLLSYPYAG
ncbi:4F2 cell-surface antigen heavy chain [Bagarius yarrelli]|uniref:4F2 cell-surface antigen heavy chain n=1 Tax=Bagarius yarrelli TaxID=175774 RepID=A0A556TZ10_BAGYA|nr:4F2 cell-surface antigen heavy chain [Bagarius yarrelli]